MPQLKIYNSYSRQKEVFKPVTRGHVGMYVCGPTVSGESHLGHARPYITFDVIYRYLKKFFFFAHFYYFTQSIKGCNGANLLFQKIKHLPAHVPDQHNAPVHNSFVGILPGSSHAIQIHP